jgi:hypothetical protein
MKPSSHYCIPALILLLIFPVLCVSGQASAGGKKQRLAASGPDSLMASNGPTADPVAAGSPAADYLEALLRFEPWAESVWKQDPHMREAGYFGDGASRGNGGIRGTCGVALAYAVLIRAFPHSPQRGRRLARVEAALRYAAETHQGGPAAAFATDGRKWGVLPSFASDDKEGWQSSMWAASMGFTAALLERQLDPSLVAACKKVVAQEASWLSKKPPASGYRYDTKAEENAWQSNILTLAAAWMPADARAPKWLHDARYYLANTYTVPTDSSCALKDWICTQTLFPSYALENHGFYHPTYQMVAGMSLGDSYLMAKMINKGVARKIGPFADHNVKPVWQFIKGIILDSGDMAFPSGLDWSLHDYEHISYLAWLADHFRAPEAEWAEPRLARQILYRQAVNGDGRFVGESCPDGFYREAVEARRVAMAFLQDQLAGFPVSKGEKPENYIVNYRDVGLMMQRSDNALTTVSYGPKTMALVYPLGGQNAAQRFIISPNTSTLIGPEGKTVLDTFQRTRRGFRAELSLNSGDGRSSRMIVESTPGAVAFVEIPRDSSRLPASGWLLSAIENDPLTGGKRTVLWAGDSVLVRDRSARKTGPVRSSWMNIDNWIGFVVPAKGTMAYRAASGYNRDGAAEDSLTFTPATAHAPRAVIILPGKNSAITRRVSKSVRWKVSRNHCRLSFKIPGSGREKIKVTL